MDAGSPLSHTRLKAPERARIDLGNCALLALLILTWAVSWPVIKIGLSEVPPLWFGVFRYAIATLCVFVVNCATHGFTTPPKADWPLVLASGSLQMAAYSAFTAMALTTLPPGRASVLAFSTPIWVVPMAAWWLNERISASALVGVVVGLVGVVVIASPSLALDSGDHLLAYVLLMCASAAWAISIVFVRQHRFAASAFALAPWQMLVAVALLLPFALLREGLPPPVGPTGAACLAFVGPVSTGFAYWAVVEAGRYFRASTMSMALLATPSLGISISAVTLGETVDAVLIAGVVIVAGGIWLTTLVSTRKSAPAEQPRKASGSKAPKADTRSLG